MMRDRSAIETNIARLLELIRGGYLPRPFVEQLLNDICDFLFKLDTLSV